MPLSVLYPEYILSVPSVPPRVYFIARFFTQGTTFWSRWYPEFTSLVPSVPKLHFTGPHCTACTESLPLSTASIQALYRMSTHCPLCVTPCTSLARILYLMCLCPVPHVPALCTSCVRTRCLPLSGLYVRYPQGDHKCCESTDSLFAGDRRRS